MRFFIEEFISTSKHTNPHLLYIDYYYLPMFEDLASSYNKFFLFVFIINKTYYAR